MNVHQECGHLRQYVKTLEGALNKTKRTVAIERDGEWYVLQPGGGDRVKVVGIVDEALAQRPNWLEPL